MPFDVLSIAQHCLTVGQLISRLHLSQEQIDDIEKSTRGQADNPKWHLARKGRLTASNFYRIHTRMETLKSNPGTDLSKLVKSILNPDDISNLPAIQHGKKMEPQAVSFLMQLLKRSHTNVKFQECGLYVDGKMPYLGASPDGVVTCDCHGVMLVEVKCPSRKLEDCDFLSEGRLREKHRYYGQVQGQMMVTGIMASYFLAYLSEEDYRLDVVQYDTDFCEGMRMNLSRFYCDMIAPCLLNKAG